MDELPRQLVYAFFITTDLQVMDTVTADRTHRHHVITERVLADLRSAALAHLPSGVFTNAAWLVLAVMAFNLTRLRPPTPKFDKGVWPNGWTRSAPGRVGM
ncbi:hypothetical protein GCM10023317_22310 [Actinopolymorpha pittospori]